MKRLSREKALGRNLTESEIEIAALCAQDLANKQIADRLGVKECTVEHHLHNTIRKLGVRSKIGVALWAASGMSK